MLALLDGRPSAAELGEVRNEARNLAEWVRAHSRGDEGIAHDALQEAVEAILLGATLDGGRAPGPADLGVDPEVYLLGLGDLVGELRRLALGRLDLDDLDGASRHVALMEDIYRTLLRFDTTRAIVQLKPKQDTARALLERTRGEVTMARLLARARPTSTGGGAP